MPADADDAEAARAEGGDAEALDGADPEAPPEASADGERSSCRICWGDDEDLEPCPSDLEGGTLLLRPCACRGTLAHACVSCLVRSETAKCDVTAPDWQITGVCKACGQVYPARVCAAVGRAYSSAAAVEVERAAGVATERRAAFDAAAAIANAAALADEAGALAAAGAPAAAAEAAAPGATGMLDVATLDATPPSAAAAEAALAALAARQEAEAAERFLAVMRSRERHSRWSTTLALSRRGRELGVRRGGRQMLCEAEELAREELAHVEENEANGGLAPYRIVECLNLLGELCRYQRRLPEAERHLRRAVESGDEKLSTPLDTAADERRRIERIDLSNVRDDAVDNLGNCLSSMGPERYDEAEKLLRRSLALTSAAEGAESPEVVRVGGCLARVLGMGGAQRVGEGTPAGLDSGLQKLGEAERLARSVLLQRARVWGREDTRTLAASRFVGELRSRQIGAALARPAVGSELGAVEVD